MGIHAIFKHIQIKNNWNKKQAWEELRIKLINEVWYEKFIPDDLEWVKGILYYDKFPTTHECLRVVQRYPNKTPLLDALKKFI